MKSIRIISVIAFAALAFMGCQKEQQEINSTTPSLGQEITIKAVREVSTKTTMSGTDILWSPSDEISLFYGAADEGGALFTSQNTEAAATADFTGILNTVAGVQEGGATQGKKFVGIYPYSSENAVATDGSATLVIEDLQYGIPGDLPYKAFPAIASSEGLELAFYNVCGLLEITTDYPDVFYITLEGKADEEISGTANVTFDENHKPVVNSLTGTKITLIADKGYDLSSGEKFYMAVPPTTFTSGVTITLLDNQNTVIETFSTTNELKVERNKIHAVNLEKPKSLTIKTLWLRQSEGTTAWNSYFGGTAGSDRNIAMDDEYVYVAENSGTAKLWAISIADPSNVTAVNVEGVSGGTHLLSCPRVIKNTDTSVNGGKDVLICSNLTRGGEDPKLYMWVDGINSAPKAITLTTWAKGAWYGDVFTAYGTLQDGVLFFDKIGGQDANGIVTFLLNGVPSGDQLYLQARLKFNDAFAPGHSGACAYYPYPDNINKGVYSPGRGVEARGQNVVATGNIKGEGGIDVALTGLDYDEGTNGYVLGYNFIEWKNKRYVIYGNQSSSTVGYVRVREGSTDTDWSVIASTGTRLYRRDLTVASGSLSSGNSGMDITARVIDGDLYFAAQKQNVACGLYKLCYE